MSRHRSSVGLRWPSKRSAALHRLPIQLGMGCAMRLALRSDLLISLRFRKMSLSTIVKVCCSPCFIATSIINASLSLQSTT
ncbi:hypothetical protein [Verminephrobacter eiseniae]|uniref:hypothetical protein n=1 Tax=Verminephrobacter eiseniae TaxID=364317 RepID=UPI0022382665|nr:hypothetical protein [Verminephrobacter eiseniae]